MKWTEEQYAVLHLYFTPDIGRKTFHALHRHYGGAANAIANMHDWQRLGFARAAKAFAKYTGPEKAVAKLTAWCENTLHAAVMLFGDADYPQGIADTGDAPSVLYMLGDTECLRARSIAMVGSRNASVVGRRMAIKLAGDLVRAGFAVVSGMAEGIDGAAHEGALNVGGKTIAVVGTGLSHIYPKMHRQLQANIIETGGLILSELPLDTPPKANNFPPRNRLIVGLSEGVVLVEAKTKSGSMITARLAMEANKEVYAVPGSVLGGYNSGCHALIKDGAQLVEGIGDIVDAADTTSDGSNQEEDTTTDPLLGLMGYEVWPFEDLRAESGLSVIALQNALLHLQLEGAVKKMFGNRWQRCR